MAVSRWAALLQPSEALRAQPSAVRQPHNAFGYHVVYSFKYNGQNVLSDGFGPSGLVAVSGALYGTTAGGGGGGDAAKGLQACCGTVFALTTSGVERILHVFVGGTDGDDPVANLIDDGGTLYGTTTTGGEPSNGPIGSGTVFSISPTGDNYKVVNKVTGGSMGFPMSPLTELNGALFGSSTGSGTNGGVYEVTASNTTRAVYNFKGAPDGAYPRYAGLLALNGVLYGTTVDRGAHGFGTVFKVTASGTETVLYSFMGGTDGANPDGGLIAMNGALYGVTTFGGSGGVEKDKSGDGTVFRVTTGGVESVVYRFQGGDGDGKWPYSSLLSLNGTLYGTTLRGGAYGLGTVYATTPSGAETLLHSFAGQGAGDGSGPVSSLVALGATIYGTTGGGGTVGSGTVFALTP